MATPVISLLVGLVAGGAFMAMWAANRIEEEGVRQFDRGFERGRWLTDISVAKAIEDQDRARRAVRPPPGHPVRSPVRRCSSSPRRAAPHRHLAPGSASGAAMPADLVAIAILVVLATFAAPLAADCRRRLPSHRFDAVYERNL